MTSHAAKRKQLVWILASVFILLIACIIWLERDRQPKPAQYAQDINDITISRNGHDDIKLVRSETDNAVHWLMSEPYALTANSQRIEPLLTLGSARLDGYTTDEVDMSATGLENPGASFSVGSRTFLLGNTDLDGERRYALVDGQVTLLPEWVWSLVHGGVSAFANLMVFESVPDALYLISESNTVAVDDIDQWRTLQADKISSLSTSDNNNQEPAQERQIARWVLSASRENDGQSQLAELIQFADHTLIQTKPGFAYAISNARLNKLLNN